MIIKISASKKQFIIFVVGLSLLSCSVSSKQETPPVIAIQSFGTFNKNFIKQIKTDINRTYRVEIIELPGRQLPAETYYKPNARYRADKLLDYMRKKIPGRYSRILGLTNKDISTTKGKYFDWGIFGLGTLDGRSCIVSTFRLRRDASHKKLVVRLIKVVNHELGHTFGIDHCPNTECVMQDGKGTIKTVDRETGSFCTTCRNRLRGLLR